jgi:mono/diheme cytochrome c family protein
MAFASGGTVALSDYKGSDPTGVPKQLASADLVKRGEYLAHAADCIACHTAPGAAAYTGGFAFNLPGIGTIYSTNITPDKDTGIGNYTDQEFLAAMHKGVRRDGQLLYPAMTYTTYSYMTDADALAIKAYLFTLPAAHAPSRENKLAWPFNQRSLLAVWNVLQCRPAIPSQSHAKRRMEPGRLSGRGHGSLRRMPHAAQSRLCDQQSAQICGCFDRRLARL